MKDSQRQKVYDAEQGFLRPGHSTYKGDIYDCQQFVNRVMARQYVKKNYLAFQRIKVKGVPKKYRYAHALCSDSVIEVGIGDTSRWARTDAVLLHEIAHILSYREGHEAGHGWHFAATFLDLVRNVMGKEAADALKAGYKAKRVRFRAPRKRATLSPEQKAAQVECLRLARKKREKALAPKRKAKERAIKLHTKTRSNKRAFGKPCHKHWLGNRKDGLEKCVWLEKDPRYMSHDAIAIALKEYDRKQRTAVDRANLKPSTPKDSWVYDEMLRINMRDSLSDPRKLSIISGTTT